MSHHPTLLTTGRHGCWCVCSCGGWVSGLWTTVVGAHLEFGRHLLDDLLDQEQGEDAEEIAGPAGPHSCFELDGARVHGDPDMPAETRAALSQVIAAARAQLAADHPDQVEPGGGR